MDGLLTRFLGGEMLNDPLFAKLLMMVIFFLGAAQAVKMIHSFWKTGKLKVQEKEVSEEKGKWKGIIEELVNELKSRNERAEKIYDKVNWLYEVHHKFDEDGVPIWYVRKSLEKAIASLAENIAKQTDALTKMVDGIRDTSLDIKGLKVEMETRHKMSSLQK